MAPKLSENMSKLIHRMRQEREDRIISGKTKLTVAAVFLMNNNCKVFTFVRWEFIDKKILLGGASWLLPVRLVSEH